VKGVVVIEDPEVRERTPRSNRPDALEPVANRPIALHVLDALESAGADEIVVASSTRRAAEVRECFEPAQRPDGPKLRFVTRRGVVDIDGALGLAEPVVDGAPCVVHLGSGLLNEPLQPLLGRLPGDWPDVVLMMHQDEPADGRLAHLAGGLPVRRHDTARANPGVAGVCLFGAYGLSRARVDARQERCDADLKQVADWLVGHGGSCDILRVSGWRQYVGNPLDLLELNRMTLDRLDIATATPGDHDNRLEGRVLIDEAASVRSSVIVGPTVIGPGAYISDAYIGPYTSVGPRAVVEGAEVERSIVDVGAAIKHVGGRLASCVIGRNARVFRDFSLPRATRLRIGEGAEVALS
jgi:glucose-1-phosphate thymidylyltransferase